MAKTKSKKKAVKIQEVPHAKVYVSASFNNTLITVTDLEGNVISWGSAGASGFKGTRKSTPYAATTAVDNVIRKAKENYNVKEVDVLIKGPGSGRDAALRAIRAVNLKLNMIADITPMPHNGPRPKKRRRV